MVEKPECAAMVITIRAEMGTGILSYERVK
jgi:hypothetical protein